MKTIVITDEVDEQLEFVGNGQGSALIHQIKGAKPKVIVLNPREEQGVKDAITTIQRERAGQKGGLTTLMKYGNGHFVKAGAKGGRPKAKTLEG